MNIKIKIVKQGVLGKAVEIMQLGIKDAEEGEVAHSNIFVDADGLHYVNDNGEDKVLSNLDGADAVYVDQNLLVKADVV